MGRAKKSLKVAPIKIKRITLWRREVRRGAEALAEVLTPFAHGNVNLQVLLRYRQPTDKKRAFIEIAPQFSDNDAKLQASLKTALALLQLKVEITEKSRHLDTHVSH